MSFPSSKRSQMLSTFILSKICSFGLTSLKSFVALNMLFCINIFEQVYSLQITYKLNEIIMPIVYHNF